MTILSVTVATVLKCLDETRDQDSKYRDQDQDQDSENAVSRLSRDETVSRGFPSLAIPYTGLKDYQSASLQLLRIIIVPVHQFCR